MKFEITENLIEFLLSATLKKCHNTHEAEDLVQETLLALMRYDNQKGEIKDLKAWLLVVLNRKFNDTLRQKYRMPTVHIGEGFDLTEETEYPLEASEEEANVRCSVAHLTKIHREVIVRHYLKGQSIETISKALNIPQNTVKSRLRLGRAQVKKGVENMEKYSENSYSPKRLDLSYSGSSSINDDPIRLVKDDLIAQNILWIAYETPKTQTEISQSLGIAAAYIEPIIKKLCDGELMKQKGNKYYTDFIISTVTDQESYIPHQKLLAKEHFNEFFNAIEQGLEKIKAENFYENLNLDQRNSLELYFTIRCLDYGIFDAIKEITNADQIFPDRPNGGKWIAMGYLKDEDYNYKKYIDIMAHSISGERCMRLGKYGNTGSLSMHEYGADGFPSYSYYRTPEQIFPENTYIGAEITKLLYILYSNTDPNSVGFNTDYLKVIPHLKKCKILVDIDGKPTVNIPVLSGSEAKILWSIYNESKKFLTDSIIPILKEFLKDKRQKLPAHLDSVPLQKQYLNSVLAIFMSVVREAMKRNKLYDGNYDDDSNGINQVPAPMILIIE